MLETYASLVNPVAKLDIRDLLKDNPSPPARTTQAPSFSRSISVPSNHSHVPLLPSPSSTSTASQYSASTAPTNSSRQHQRQQSRQLPPQPIYLSKMSQAVFEQNPDPNPPAAAPNKRPLPADDRTFSSPAKKQSKWSPAEDAEIIRLRGSGMKWEDISKKLRGRSAISCRLHYQNYLERRSEWDEEKRNRLARVYDRYVSNHLRRLQPSKFDRIHVKWRQALTPTDSNTTCGVPLQMSSAFPGAHARLCIGLWANTKWPDEPTPSPSPSLLPKPRQVNQAAAESPREIECSSLLECSRAVISPLLAHRSTASMAMVTAIATVLLARMPLLTHP